MKEVRLLSNYTGRGVAREIKKLRNAGKDVATKRLSISKSPVTGTFYNKRGKCVPQRLVNVLVGIGEDAKHVRGLRSGAHNMTYNA